MLNISEQKIRDLQKTTTYSSFSKVYNINLNKAISYWMYGFFSLLIILLFLPWTQNIQSRGNVTTLYPEQRPQNVESAIAGRIEKWFVREGMYVEKGDTIVQMSEIKDSYFDPKLIERTESQVKAVNAALNSYTSKVVALDNQIAALEKTREFKLSQARNKIRQTELKVQADSIEFEAAKVGFEIAKKQFDRQQILYDQGLKSLTDLEKRTNNFQKAQAELIAKESKLLSSKNELINAKLEISTLENEFADKLAKSNSEKYSALSAQFDTEAKLQKLENQLSNYEIRVGYRLVVAPQSGMITKTVKAGIGETIKEGEMICTIVPSQYDLAVELYVKPLDLPLIKLGEEVRLQFDGWPVIVFSGWPNVSFGTFGGRVFAIDNDISANGKYRILIAPDPQDEDWPELVRVGSGAFGFALLNDVPIWYEIWRQINGFPPDYYTGDSGMAKNASAKSDKK